MAKNEVLGIFKTFLDEATENESFGTNITESDQHILRDSINNIPTLKVTIPNFPIHKIL